MSIRKYYGLILNTVLLLGIAFLYSIHVFRLADLDYLSMKHNNSIVLLNQNDEKVYIDVLYESNQEDKIYVTCLIKYALNTEYRYSIRYDAESLVISSFQRKVYARHIKDMKCIEVSNSPASSYRGVVSWFTTFNIIGCNIDEISMVFEIKNDNTNLSNISELITLDF